MDHRPFDFVFVLIANVYTNVLMIMATRVHSIPPNHLLDPHLTRLTAPTHVPAGLLYKAKKTKGPLDAQAESRPLSTRQRTHAALNVGKEACPTTTSSHRLIPVPSISNANRAPSLAPQSIRHNSMTFASFQPLSLRFLPNGTKSESRSAA